MRRALSIMVVSLTLCGAAPVETIKTAEERAMPIYAKITPVLLAEDVEACVELMYQSFAMSSAQDPGAITGVRQAIVYIEVEALSEIEKRLGDAELVVPVRDTGHGTRELYVRDPAGNLIGFAESLPQHL